MSELLKIDIGLLPDYQALQNGENLSIPFSEYGKAIRIARTLRGESILTVATHLEMSTSTISKMESSDENVNLHKLKKVLSYLGLKIEPINLSKDEGERKTTTD